MAASYHLSFPDPKSHLVHIEVLVDPPPGDTTEAWMAVWSPGSYLVREYARNVQTISALATGGQPLLIVKTSKNRWQIETRGVKALTLRYTLYGLVRTVRTNWIDADYAFLNGPSTFLLVDGADTGPFRVTVDTPPQWNRAFCPLAPTDKTIGSDGAAGPASLTYTAPDLDTLLDSPILCGSPQAYAFTSKGKSITLINEGESGLWDGKQAARDTQSVVETYGAMFGGFPFERYLFYNLIVEGRGGLEHRDASVLMTSRYAYRSRKTYADWLSLVSHEFFHVWNVKRSRPAELGPFDYESEVYTRNLWVAEGITAYYTDLVPKRAGLFTEEEYLKTLSGKIDKLQNTPGRLVQSLEDASFDAWIKLYRPDENLVNATVSYYLKGCLVGWLLDVEIRILSKGARSLDSFFSHFVRGTEELQYSAALDYLGLQFQDSQEPKKPWMGISHETKENQIFITAVRNDGPGRKAGLMAEDEIVALNGFRVTPKNHDQLAAQYRPGDTVEILISRAGALRTLTARFGEAPQAYRLAVRPNAEESVLARRNAWWSA